MAISESYSRDIDFSFTAPEGWEVDRVTGLYGNTIQGRNARGTPVSQTDISISQEISTDVVFICIGVGMIIVLVVLLIILIVEK